MNRTTPSNDDDGRPPAGRTLDVYLLGTLDFDSAWRLQQWLTYDLGCRNDGRGALLLYDWPPLLTVGREAPPGEWRRWWGTRSDDDVRWVARGGGVIVHGPGQLVASPILPLAHLGCGIVGLRDRMLACLTAVCDELRVEVERVPETGVLRGRSGRVAEVGLAVRSGMTCQGLFVNVHPLELPSNHALPRDLQASSLAIERGQMISMGSVRETLARHLAAAFGYDHQTTYTTHPLLRRLRQPVR